MENEFDPVTPPSAQAPAQKRPVGKAVLVNFGIMLVYCILAMTVFKGGWELNVPLYVSMVLLQTSVNAIAGMALLFFPRYKPLGSAMILAGLVIFLVGFGLCAGTILMST